ncbi:MAG: PH domain-containing protein [Streptosporangiales bacterium]|nr:PH domain-containing protein [Streptosporangiales bacterium]
MSQVRLRPPAHRVDRRAIWLWTLQALTGAITTVGLGCVGAAVISATRPGWLPEWLLDRTWLLPVVIGVLFLPEVTIAPVWRYRVHRWEVSADVVYTRAGWFSRTWQLVPVARVQTVDRTQGLLERLFGLATLRVTTASHAGSSLIVGLRDPVATELSETLAVQAGELRDDAT